MIAKELEQEIKLLKSPSILSRTKIDGDKYSFELVGKQNSWNISLWFPVNFPYCLPSARLLDKQFIGIIPHVNRYGTICIEESDTVLLDYERPSDIIDAYLEDALNLLERAKLKIYQDELFDEYEGYFGFYQKVNSFYHAQDKLEHVSLKLMYRANNRQQKFAIPILLYDKSHAFPKNFSNVSNTNSLQVVNVIHLPLIESVLPPNHGNEITATYVDTIKDNVTEKNIFKLNKLLKKAKNKNQFFVLLTMPRSSGERSQLLLQYTTDQSLKHPLAELNTGWKVTSYLINRHNKEYLLERGGADNSLINKKVSIIGCGSVGGEVAALLAKGGVGELTLIDNEGLEADNIYRHRLGGDHLNFIPNSKSGTVTRVYKVNAIAAELSGELPYIKINPKHVEFNKVTSDNDFLNSDVVIVAVGSPTTSLLMNKKLKSLGLNKVIFCWNEAAGYGGHSLALDLELNCLECIYTSENGFTVESDISLLKLGQNISKNLTGCSGVFTPFSYLDSTQTAIQAAKQCIDLLLENKHSKALSWKGDNNKNLEVTDRFTRMPLKEEILLSRKNKCRVCND